ncbi:hypothetical protein AAFF_G00374720 [Aldrovandia affinis]|uniref:Uncharacterized protein n=1 Tax=Aldrovandia affinis TaxID=143900 RepID=A0AAD7WLX1_9TELE|nr:hypothetical protein AAFF_G00374720 [Aldrovandia affinis]
MHPPWGGQGQRIAVSAPSPTPTSPPPFDRTGGRKIQRPGEPRDPHHDKAALLSRTSIRHDGLCTQHAGNIALDKAACQGSLVRKLAVGSNSQAGGKAEPRAMPSVPQTGAARLGQLAHQSNNHQKEGLNILYQLLLEHLFARSGKVIKIRKTSIILEKEERKPHWMCLGALREFKGGLISDGAIKNASAAGGKRERTRPCGQNQPRALATLPLSAVKNKDPA